MRIANFRTPGYIPVFIVITCIVGLGIFAGPSIGQDQPGTVTTSSRTVSVNHFANGFGPLTASALRAVQSQDATQSTPPPAASPTPPAAPRPSNKVELPEGDGKAIATEYCQDCHRLTNLITAHKTADDWRDTVHLMMDRGARLPDDQVDSLVQYLAKNFGPAPATPAQTSPAPDAQATPGATAPVISSTPAAKNKIELPEGDGKAIATEYCQDCHRLNNVTMARKSPEEWNDTVHLMVDRGARIPDDKVDALVQYLAKNFGAKAGGTGSAPSADPPSTPGSSSK